MKLKEYFAPYLAYMSAKGLTDKTVREHERVLQTAFSNSIQDIELMHLKMTDCAFLEAAGRSHGKYGSQRAIVVLRKLMAYIREAGQVLPFDWRDIKIPRVPRLKIEYLTDDEIELVRNAIDLTTLAGLRTRTIMEVMLSTGMRIGEVCRLNKKDVKPDTFEAEIENIKTKERQKVYFTPIALEWLKRYWEARGEDSEWAFTSGRGRLLPSTAKTYLRVVAKNVGIDKHLRYHIFRKTLCTRLLQNGADIKSTQYIMRHNSERTTLRYYAGVNIEKCRDVHQLIAQKLNQVKLSTVLPQPNHWQN